MVCVLVELWGGQISSIDLKGDLRHSLTVENQLMKLRSYDERKKKLRKVLYKLVQAP